MVKEHKTALNPSKTRLSKLSLYFQSAAGYRCAGITDSVLLSRSIRRGERAIIVGIETSQIGLQRDAELQQVLVLSTVDFSSSTIKGVELSVTYPQRERDICGDVVLPLVSDFLMLVFNPTKATNAAKPPPHPVVVADPNHPHAVVVPLKGVQRSFDKQRGITGHEDLVDVEEKN